MEKEEGKEGRGRKSLYRAKRGKGERERRGGLLRPYDDSPFLFFPFS